MTNDNKEVKGIVDSGKIISYTTLGSYDVSESYNGEKLNSFSIGKQVLGKSGNPAFPAPESFEPKSDLALEIEAMFEKHVAKGAEMEYNRNNGRKLTRAPEKLVRFESE